MKNKGISLIMLIITIILIIILAGAVIITFANNNVIGKSEEAVFKSDLNNYKEQLNLYIMNNLLEDNNYNKNTLNAYKTNGEHVINSNKVFFENGILNPILNMKTEHQEILAIKNGILVIRTDDEKLLEWAKDVGVEDGSIIETDYTLEEIEKSTNMLAIGLTKPEYVIAIQEKDGTLKIVKNTKDSDGKMKENANLYYEPKVKSATKLIVENGVKNIGYGTFVNYVSLTGEVVLPKSTTSVGSSAFSGCTGITSIKSVSKDRVRFESACLMIPSGKLKEVYIENGDFDRNIFTSGFTNEAITLTINAGIIGDSAFENQNIKNLNLGEKIELIGKNAFYGIKIQKLVINSGEVLDCAFASSKELKDVVIKGTTQLKGKDIFESCSNVETVEIGGDVKTISFRSFANLKKMNTLIIHEGIEKIESYAFSSAESLKELVLPKSIKSIEEGAFLKAISLEKITIKNGVIGDYAFSQIPALKQLVLENGVTSIGIEAFSKASIQGKLIIPDTVNNIEKGAFSANKQLTEVVLPFSVKVLKNYVFRDCTSLIKINLDHITEIQQYTFTNCTALDENLILPDNIISIGENAFEGCTTLKKVKLPKNLKKLDYSVFCNCINLESVIFNEGLEVIEWGVFEGANKMSGDIIFPSTLLEFNFPFTNTSTITSITLPNCVTSLPKNEFSSVNQNTVIKINKVQNSIVGSPWGHPGGISKIQWGI